MKLEKKLFVPKPRRVFAYFNFMFFFFCLYMKMVIRTTEAELYDGSCCLLLSIQYIQTCGAYTIQNNPLIPPYMLSDWIINTKFMKQ